MNKLENAVIKYQIDFEKYKNGQANEVIDLLDKACREISVYLKKTTGVYTKARYQELVKKIKSISKSLKENVDSNIAIDDIINYELKKEKKLLKVAESYIKKGDSSKIDFLYPALEQIKTAALFKPIDTKYGMTYQSYLDGIENGLYNVWDSAIRTGYLTGQTTQQIVHSVLGGVSAKSRLVTPGTINSFRNSVYSNTRTVLQSFANETRNRVYEENEKYFGSKDDYKYEYLSTLDSRTCLVCGELSGKLFKSLKDSPALPQHRGCVLDGTLVSTVGGISKVYKRRYKGLLYRITTASGNTLTVTPNHPILTDKGFIRAHLLNVGDNVVSDDGLETLDIIGEGKDNRQALIQDVFRSFRKNPSMVSCTMPAAAEDFHGDTVYNKVHIVTADRELRSKRNVSFFKDFVKKFFIRRFNPIDTKTHKGGFFPFFDRLFSAFTRFMRIFRKFINLFFCVMSHSFKLLFVRISHRDIVAPEKSNNLCSGKAEPFCNASNTDSMIVKFKNFINAKIIGKVSPSGADAGSVHDVADNVFGNTELSSNIFDRYSTQIKIDRITDVDVIKKSCHVYNLETENGWYIANGIITHNCRCLIIPYFNIDNDTKASKNGYVDSNVTFEKWLDEQDEKTQQEVLGKTRYNLYKNGEKIKDFVDDGKKLTIAQIEEKLGNAETPIPKEKVKQEPKKDDMFEETEMEKELKKLKVEPIELKKLEKPLTENEIIDRISGGDETKGGSCASLAFAYATNKYGGYDMLDFRGGISRDYFASLKNLEKIAKLDGVSASFVTNSDEFKIAKELMKKVELGKEYNLMVGCHSAIIRKTKDGKIKYLELQEKYQFQNGFFELNDNRLATRFGCQINRFGNEYDSLGILIDIETLPKNMAFISLMRYINTNANKQIKGLNGSMK